MNSSLEWYSDKSGEKPSYLSKEAIREKPEEFIKKIRFRDGEVPLSNEFPREIVELVMRDKVVRKALAEIMEKRGEDDVKHAVRMAGMVILAADKMDFSPEDRETLIRSALVHDVGKIGIPSEILDKPGKLSEEEAQTVHKHARMGWNFLRELGDDKLAEIVVRHHEISGYPRSGKDQREIERPDGKERRMPKPEYDRLAKLLSIFDVFDSLGSRPYNDKKTRHEILAERAGELEDLNAPEEMDLIALLEGREIDPRYILQKEVEKNAEGFSSHTAS